MRSGPITSQCFPIEGPEACGFVVIAKLPPLPGSKRAQPWLDETFDTEEEARAAFLSTLHEDGLELHSIGWGEIFPEDRHGDRHIEFTQLLTADQIRKALEKGTAA